MDKQDVLVSDMRVAALAEDGPYYFSWVDENNNIVTLAEECKYTKVPEDVAKAVRQHDIKIVEEDLAVDNSQEVQDTTKNQSDSDLIGSPNSENKKTDRQSDSDLIGSPDTSESSTNLIGSSGASSDTVDEEYNVMLNSNTNSESDAERVSFLVRMDNPEERNKIVQKLKSSHNNASKKLQLTGPFKVIYEVKENSLELVGVEDMGIGSKTGETDI
jgi:hypothetical protein